LSATRITESFARSERGLIPFITAGDPDLRTTRDLLIELGQAGSTVIELGVPFSDPMADGPVIQRASERALKHSLGIGPILEVVAEVRLEIDTPIILFSYFNPLLQYGVERLSREAKAAGVDGILVTDLTPEESADVASSFHANDLDMIFLIAPTSTDARLELVANHASGFIYAVSRRGVTGQQQKVSLEAMRLVERVRRFSELPVAVGFGISTSDQVEQTWRYADAAVVGSAIVAEIERLEGSPDLVSQVGKFVRSLIPRNKLHPRPVEV